MSNLALRSHSGACQKWMNEWMNIPFILLYFGIFFTEFVMMIILYDVRLYSMFRSLTPPSANFPDVWAVNVIWLVCSVKQDAQDLSLTSISTYNHLHAKMLMSSLALSVSGLLHDKSCSQTVDVEYVTAASQLFIHFFNIIIDAVASTTELGTYQPLLLDQEFKKASVPNSKCRSVTAAAFNNYASESQTNAGANGLGLGCDIAISPIVWCIIKCNPCRSYWMNYCQWCVTNCTVICICMCL